MTTDCGDVGDGNSLSTDGCRPAAETGERDCQDSGSRLGFDGDKYLLSPSSLGNDALLSSALRRETLLVVGVIVGGEEEECSSTLRESERAQSTQ